MSPPSLPRIRTTNALAQLLASPPIRPIPPDEIEMASALKRRADYGEYEEKEKDIPELICDVLRKGDPFRRLTKRCFFEDDAWLVRVGCGEGESLHDHGHEVFTSSSGGEVVPALSEGKGVSMHFVKIRVPEVFVRTLSLPMLQERH